MNITQNIIKFSIISTIFATAVAAAAEMTASTATPSMTTAAAQPPSLKTSSPTAQLKITNLQLKSANPKVVSNADCEASSNQTISVDPATGDQKIGNNIVLKDIKRGHTYTSHNLSRKVWTANLVYTGKNGKTSHSRVYGEELMIKGMDVAYGSFINGYCEGFYKKTY